jgi:hypothetical protein
VLKLASAISGFQVLNEDLEAGLVAAVRWAEIMMCFMTGVRPSSGGLCVLQWRLRESSWA